MNEFPSAALDAALIRARDGDREAFAMLVRGHRRAVYSLGLRMLGAPEIAEELAQEVFMQLYGSLKSIESGAHLTFWLRRVMTHRAIDHIRQHARIETLPLEDVAQAAPSDHGDVLLERQLRRLVLLLAPDARAVMTLRYQEDLDPADIASVLDMPVNTVKSHLKRSLDSLRRALSGPVGTPTGGAPWTKN